MNICSSLNIMSYLLLIIIIVIVFFFLHLIFMSFLDHFVGLKAHAIFDQQLAQI